MVCAGGVCCWAGGVAAGGVAAGGETTPLFVDVTELTTAAPCDCAALDCVWTLAVDWPVVWATELTTEVAEPGTACETADVTMPVWAGAACTAALATCAAWPGEACAAEAATEAMAFEVVAAVVAVEAVGEVMAVTT